MSMPVHRVHEIHVSIHWNEYDYEIYEITKPQSYCADVITLGESGPLP